MLFLFLILLKTISSQISLHLLGAYVMFDVIDSKRRLRLQKHSRLLHIAQSNLLM